MAMPTRKKTGASGKNNAKAHTSDIKVAGDAAKKTVSNGPTKTKSLVHKKRTAKTAAVPTSKKK